MPSRFSLTRTTSALIKNGRKPLKDHSIFLERANHRERKERGDMRSCSGRKSQWEKRAGVHDVSAQRTLFPSCLKCLSSLESCSRDISNSETWSHVSQMFH